MWIQEPALASLASAFQSDMYIHKLAETLTRGNNLLLILVHDEI